MTLEKGQTVKHRKIISKWFSSEELFEDVTVIGIGATINERSNLYNGFQNKEYNEVLVSRNGNQFVVRSYDLFS